MDGKQKIFLLILGIIMVAFAVHYGLDMLAPKEILPENVPVSERTTEEVVPKPENTQKEYVNVFFIGQNDSREEVYKAVKREYDAAVDGSKLRFAINSLIAGPKMNEVSKGVYTEIPAGTEANRHYFQISAGIFG